MSHCFIVMEMPYDKDERPIVHGVFEDCYAAMVLFGIVADKMRAKANAPVRFYSDSVARIEVFNPKANDHMRALVVERVPFTRRPEP